MCEFCGKALGNALHLNALHLTVRGKIVPGTGGDAATEQFSISDDRHPRAVEKVLTQLGLDPVWKDWDAGILGAA